MASLLCPVLLIINCFSTFVCCGGCTQRVVCEIVQPVKSAAERRYATTDANVFRPTGTSANHVGLVYFRNAKTKTLNLINVKLLTNEHKHTLVPYNIRDDRIECNSWFQNKGDSRKSRHTTKITVKVKVIVNT